jgi:hypothetical protein
MMSRIFAWIVDRLRWLLLAAAAGGIVLTYMGWTDAARIRELQANGVEASAFIESATRTKGRRSGERFSLKLSWRDAKGEQRIAEGVSVSNVFARSVIRGDKIVVDRVRIKYLPEGIDAPLVVDDAARQADTDDFMLTAGMGLAGVGGAGSLLMFLLARRRRGAEASAPAQ